MEMWKKQQWIKILQIDRNVWIRIGGNGKHDDFNK